MRRRPDLTVEQFLRHYEQIHAPMGYTHYRFTKYVRNHVDSCPAGEFDYDVVAEFYPDFSKPPRDLSETVLRAFADDRAAFMDTKRTGGLVDEQIVFGPPRGVDPVGLRKYGLVVRDTSEALFATLTGAAVDAGIARASIDRFRDAAPERDFSALLWVWAETLPDDLVERIGQRPEVCAVITVRSYETPPAMLSAAA
jgi:hypothetical protein